jgi:hypothetical protein
MSLQSSWADDDQQTLSLEEHALRAHDVYSTHGLASQYLHRSKSVSVATP